MVCWIKDIIICVETTCSTEAENGMLNDEHNYLWSRQPVKQTITFTIALLPLHTVNSCSLQGSLLSSWGWGCAVSRPCHSLVLLLALRVTLALHGIHVYFLISSRHSSFMWEYIDFSDLYAIMVCADYEGIEREHMRKVAPFENFAL